MHIAVALRVRCWSADGAAATAEEFADASWCVQAMLVGRDCLVLGGDSQTLSSPAAWGTWSPHGDLWWSGICRALNMGVSVLLHSAKCSQLSSGMGASYLGIQVSTADATSKSLCFVRDYWLLHGVVGWRQKS